MPRYAVIENGVVVGVLSASAPPTINVANSRLFVDITELPDVQGGESHDGFMFLPTKAAPDLIARLSKVEADVAVLKAKILGIVTP